MAQTRRLYRSRTNRKLAGVCGGLAQYFNTDATLIRVLFVVLALLGGPRHRGLPAHVDHRPRRAVGRGLAAGPQFTPSLGTCKAARPGECWIAQRSTRDT
jgi:phage shock protein C